MVSGKTTIIMRTKDRPLLLRRALESVLVQTDEDWALSVVNDGGEPTVLETLLDGYRDRFGERLQVSHNPESLGMEAASNVAIRAVDGKYCVIHDDDDSWDPRFLEKTTAQLESLSKYPSVAGMVSGFYKVDERIEDDVVIKEKETDVSGWRRDLSFWHMCASNLFPPIAFLYKREAFQTVGYYDESLPVLGDWDFNLRFMMKYDIEKVDEPLAYYHYRAPKEGDVYANSVTAGLGRHEFHSRLLKNKFLREDIQSGSVGLGLAVNVASDFLDIMKHRWETEHYRQTLAAIHDSTLWKMTRPVAAVTDKLRGR